VTSRWRQFTTAIDQEWVRPQAGPLGEEHTRVNHAWQLGHTEETEEHHYALSVDMLQRVTHQTLTEFRRVSTRWHRFWGLATREDERQLLEAEANHEDSLQLRLLRQLVRRQDQLEAKLDRGFKDYGEQPSAQARKWTLKRVWPHQEEAAEEVVEEVVEEVAEEVTEDITDVIDLTTWDADAESPPRPRQRRRENEDAPVDQLLHRIMGSTANFKSVGQRQAVDAVASNK
jgi:hypothetical protein